MIDSVDIKADRITWVCSCRRERVAKVSGLRLGHEESANAIVLPPCDCGAQTTLFRTWESEPDVLHRRAINALAEHLKAGGRTHPSHRNTFAAEKAAKRQPPLLVDLGAPVEDILGRRAAREAAKAYEAQMASAREQAEMARAPEPPLPPAPPPPAGPTPDEQERARVQDLFERAERRRLVVAKASVNKRLGLPPGSEPPAEDLEAELARPAGAFLV